MTKMTDEELDKARRVADALNEEKTSTVHRLLAHIAALTAERDEWRRESEAHNAAATQYEADIRERVTALEADLLSQCQHTTTETVRADAAESRLAAMRQRAESLGPEMRLFVERAILGDDAPVPSEMDGLEGEMVETRTVDTMREVEGVRILTARVAAPTTSEAFVKVVRNLRLQGYTELGETLQLLSLLERRMGAQDAVLRAQLNPSGHTPVCEEDGRNECTPRCAQIRAALTDTPPVFTLEKREKVLILVHNAAVDVRRLHLLSSKESVREAILSNLEQAITALRR